MFSYGTTVKGTSFFFASGRPPAEQAASPTNLKQTQQSAPHGCVGRSALTDYVPLCASSFFFAAESISLMRLSWLTSLAPGS